LTNTYPNEIGKFGKISLKRAGFKNEIADERV